jgi:class 3 adenylate cyclase
MAEPSILGERLRRCRLAAGLTQEELAEQAAVSARAVSDLERGVIQTPRRDTLLAILRALPLDDQERGALLALRRSSGTTEPITSTTPAPAQPSAPDVPAVPSGMLTVLIADVRGYTAFTHQYGDEAAARLTARFAALCGEVVAGEGGQMVEVRGDEVLAVFTSARAALRAAAGLVVRCEAESTPALPLRAGVGLDVGEPVAVPGGYRGAVLNVAARLCSQAGPGEVLASDAAVALARRIEGLQYQERGELTLKGIDRPVRAWLVRSGVQEAISQAISGPALAVPRHNVPAALSSFIGRERERQQVMALLVEQRLVTLVGGGGVGKTRLALAVAGELVGRYPEGVWLVELAPLAEPSLVPGAVAQALGVREEPARALAATLEDHLKDKRLLLMLDNCEHLVEACATLARALLRGCPRLHVLATSREGLGVAGERIYPVPSLSIPDARHLSSAALADIF